MEYDPKRCQWLIQGILAKDSKGPYPSLPWKLGVISKIESSGEQGAEGDAVNRAP
jgi:hypothetical protein